MTANLELIGNKAQRSEGNLLWRQRFRALFLTAVVAVFEQDADLRYTWIRDPYAIFDIESSLGKTDEDLFPATEASKLTNIKRMVLDRGAGAREVVRLTGVGKITTVEMLIGPLVSNSGEIIGVIGTLRDIFDEVNVAAEDAQPSQSQAHRQKYLDYLGRSVADIRDDERNRLVRRLHDLLGPNLTALSLELGVLGMQIDAQSSDQQTHALLDDARSLAEELGGIVRNLMQEVQPPLLGEGGLIPSLLAYKAAFAQRVGIDVVVKENSFPELSSDVEEALFRIIQEALNNAAKYSDANHITISLTTDGIEARVVIADDGRGFDVERYAANSEERGWGLILMKERADAIDGCFHVESVPGEGARVVVEVHQ